MANSSRGRGRGSGSRHPARRPAQRPAAARHASTPPTSATPQGGDPYGPGLSGWMAKRTGWLLYWLSQRPTWFLPGCVLVLLLVGLIWRPWGGFALLFLTALFTWMTILSWPVLNTVGKVVRVLICVGLPIYAVTLFVVYFHNLKVAK